MIEWVKDSNESLYTSHKWQFPLGNKNIVLEILLRYYLTFCHHPLMASGVIKGQH